MRLRRFAPNLGEIWANGHVCEKGLAVPSFTNFVEKGVLEIPNRGMSESMVSDAPRSRSESHLVRCTG